MKRFKTENGYSMTEMLVTLGIASGLFLVLTSSFMSSTQKSFDHRIITRADELANNVLDIVAYDVRMLGSGMPLDQNDFRMTDVAFPDDIIPLDLSSSSTTLAFKFNEKGQVTYINSDFTPDAFNDQFEVQSLMDFEVGDDVFISDHTNNDEDGFWTRIESINGNLVELDSMNVAYTPGATFEVGSVVAKTKTVTYDNPAGGDGVTRDDGWGAVTLAPDADVTFEYLDAAGNTMATPLSRGDVANSLASIRITVELPGEARLKDGTQYTAFAEEVVTLRNLLLARY